MIDHEDIDIDQRIRHYKNLSNYLGNIDSKFWRNILELLADFYINQSDSDD